MTIFTRTAEYLRARSAFALTRRVPRRLGLGWALLLAAGAGLVLDAGFPQLGIWPLSFVGVGMLLFAVIGRGFWSGTLVGFVGGLAFYLAHVSWAALYLGPVPWLALSFLEAVFFGLGLGLIALAYRFVPRTWGGRRASLLLLPLIVAGIWTAREWVSSNWPYGGFAWGRLALAHSESPFAPLVSWIGLSGLSFVIALLAAIGVQLLRGGVVARPRLLAWPAVLLVLLLAVPVNTTEQIGVSRIAAVQGNAKAGYFDERSPGDILTAQADETLKLRGEQVDMIVWPEGATDIDPLNYATSAQALNTLTGIFNAPIITGAITTRDGAVYNSSILWKQNEGAADIYDKARPVPFGEYIPDRSFWRPFAPDLIDLVARDYTPGTRDNVFDVNGIIAGISICFDIVDDSLLRTATQSGAQVILAQTNNADFGTTDENQQQLAIARLRAVETGRSVVNISTVGRSQMIAADGSTIAEIPAYEPGTLVADVPLYYGVTVGVEIGALVTGFVSWGGLLALGTAIVVGRRRRR